MRRQPLAVLGTAVKHYPLSFVKVRHFHNPSAKTFLPTLWGYTVPVRASVYPLFYGDTDVKFLSKLKMQLPVHKSTLESWIKLLDDVTKAAAVAAIPLLLFFNSYSLFERIASVIVLGIIGYIAQVTADKLRRKIDSITGKDSSCS